MTFGLLKEKYYFCEKPIIFKMGRTSGQATKEKIILEAFILFSTKQYDNVTFVDIERATGLSRGSIIYHFKNKHELFEAVVESSLLNRMSILNIPIRDNDCLKFFILDFIQNCETVIKSMADHGIENINLAHYIIESTAFCFFDNFNKRSRQMQEVELAVWTKVVKRALEKKEIRDDVEPDILALLFMNLYLGHAYSATKDDNGCDLKQLHKELFTLYDMVMAVPKPTKTL